MDPVACRLRLDPRDVDQQLRARITAEIESVIPDLRRHAAQPTAARTRHQSAVARAAKLCRRLGVSNVIALRLVRNFAPREPRNHWSASRRLARGRVLLWGPGWPGPRFGRAYSWVVTALTSV